MTDTEHEAGCLMCAVRQLTEGRPREWALQPERTEGDTVTGVVLAKGIQPSHFAGQVPFLDLWLGGTKRVRIAGHSATLLQGIENVAALVGDTVTVTFRGPVEITSGKMAGHSMKVYEVAVTRGHR